MERKSEGESGSDQARDEPSIELSFLLPKFMKIRVSHDEEVCEEYAKLRWARLHMNLYCGKQRAFANFFNESGTLKGDEPMACSSVWSRALGTRKREHASSNDKNVQGVRKAFRYDTNR